jgi:hypothetical protein
LRAQEEQLDMLYSNITNALHIIKEDPVDRPYCYVPFSHLREAPSLAGNTVITVKAPQDSVSAIEVSDPAETGKFEIGIRNQQNHPLAAYYLPPSPTAEPIEMNETHAQAAQGPSDINVRSFDYKPLSDHNPLNSIISPSKYLVSPVKGRQNNHYDFDFMSSADHHDSTGIHHQNNYPMHFASPLKMAMNDNHYMNGGLSSNAEELSHDAFISLDPIQEPQPYLYGLDEHDGIHSLYDPTTDHW